MEQIEVIECEGCGETHPKKEMEVLRISESPKDKIGKSQYFCFFCAENIRKSVMCEH